MDELTLFDLAETGSECRFPHLAPSSGYRYGCRCERCAKYKVEYHATPIVNQCTIEGCELMKVRMKHARYCEPHMTWQCKAAGCTNHRRRVQGGKYCDEHATIIDGRWLKHTNRQTANFEKRECVVCGEEHTLNKRTRYDICHQCREPVRALIDRAGLHHVPIDKVVAWVKSPICGICSRPLYIGKGKGGSQGFAIDHNHACCPGKTGCARCVRDLLCTGCNISAGHAEKILSRIDVHNLIEYLMRGAPTLEDF